LIIADQGTGMDLQTREQIFEPFFTTKEVGKGTGLGLASVYGIVKAHGGYIEVESAPGQGAKFSIYFPASKSALSTAATSAATLARGRETLLLVDDEEMIIEVGQELLERLGYKVCVARSGQEAIQAYADHQQDIALVILDMVMPNISGGETYDRLKAIDPGVKVLLSSGYSLEGQAAAILARGCNGFIQKPFRLEQISSKIREIIASPA
jgi:CheY-like chemotaxis protein